MPQKPWQLKCVDNMHLSTAFDAAARLMVRGMPTTGITNKDPNASCGEASK
jgi:hypothetical protein